MHTSEEICAALNIDFDKIFNIYPYGSQIYGCNTPDSDEDYVIVYKSAFLPSGAFKDNAISSADRKIQGTCYSRTGFLDAIRTYEITALECVFLPEEKIVQKKFNFKIDEINNNELAKKLISLSSVSFFIATTHKFDADLTIAKKNLFHAIRILDFGIQIKKNGMIIDYSSCNNLKEKIMTTPDEKFRFSPYTGEFFRLKTKISR